MNAFNIETIAENEIYLPYCVVLIIKNTKKSFYINLEKRKNNLVYEAILFIFNSLNKKEKIKMYVHNLNFDGILIISELSSSLNEIHIKPLMHKGSIYSIILTCQSKTINFLCSYKYLPMSLSNIAKTFKLPQKLPFPYKFVKSENLFYRGKLPSPDFFNNKAEWAEVRFRTIFDFKKYSIICGKRDIIIIKLFMEILQNLVIQVIKLKNSKAISAPSLALEIFKKKFNIKSVKTSINKVEDNLLREAYFGGRCEVFGNPTFEEKIFHYDFNGMYAQCMQSKFCYGN